MAQWRHVSQMIPCLSDDTVNNLYPPNAFPIEVRHFLAEWIETQRWYDTNTCTQTACTNMLAYTVYGVFVRMLVVCACSVALCVDHYACVCVCSQGRLCAGEGGAGEPGSGSVGPDHQHAAIDGSAERQRGGQDEADADQQEHGRGS